MDLVRAGGPGFILALLIGMIGVGLALGGIVAAFNSKGAAVPFGAAVVLVGTSLCAGCTGVLSYGNSMSKMNRALANAEIESDLRRMIEAEGTFEASIPLMAGIGGSILPGIAGVVCGMIAIQRRSQPRPVE